MELEALGIGKEENPIASNPWKMNSNQDIIWILPNKLVLFGEEDELYKKKIRSWQSFAVTRWLRVFGVFSSGQKPMDAIFSRLVIPLFWFESSSGLFITGLY